jgi:hypothetical protein
MPNVWFAASGLARLDSKVDNCGPACQLLPVCPDGASVLGRAGTNSSHAAPSTAQGHAAQGVLMAGVRTLDAANGCESGTGLT